MLKRIILLTILAFGLYAMAAFGQSPDPKPRVRTVTIPISIFTKKEIKENQPEEFVQADQLMVKEDRDDQQILSIRSVSDSPLSVAFLIQEDLASSFNLQIKDIQDFIKGLPERSRVMIAYSRSGTIQVAQRFTDDRNRAAKSLRVVASSSSMAPRSPYDGVQEVLKKFDGVPAGRRAILLFSDGLDTSEGLSLASTTQSFELDQAILKAQRQGTAVYAFYSPTTTTQEGNSIFINAAQGALNKLAHETGGRAFFQGTMAPVSYLPFFREMVIALNRQFALTYLSTHMNKGYHKVVVQSTNPEIRIDHPKGYYYR